MIATLETVHGRAIQRSGLDPVSFLIRQHWASVLLPPWDQIRSGKMTGSVEARVNHGRWVVDCPTEGCAAAQLASDTDRRFVCVECACGPYEVVWPPDREAIEEALLARADLPARNWEPGETAADLHAENEERA